MTIPQVFKWFCKEQKIMPLMQKMYHTIHPYELTYTSDKKIDYKYLTFDEYIDKKIKNSGFSYVIQRIIEEYTNKIRPTMSYDEFWTWRDEFNDELYGIFRKWEYFVRHNILADDKIERNKVYKFKNWGTAETIRISSYDICQGRIYGHVKRNEGEMIYTIRLGDLLDDDEKELEIDFKIKRKRKIYNGRN